MSNQPFRVAIDGPAGAGKSTVARLTAQQLGFIYVDTGAMYRAVTYLALRSGYTPVNQQEISQMVLSMEMQLMPSEIGQQVIVNGENVTEFIRTPAVNENVSQLSQIEDVRIRLIGWQRDLATNQNVVMDGRDIGTRVLPDAEVKIFLTASAEARAQRRLLELKGKYPDITLEQLIADLQKRDHSDEQRKSSPLICADDAIRIDSSNLSIDQVVDLLVHISQQKRNGGQVL